MGGEMTEVCIHIDKGGYLLRADGHATGKPNVCAAISGIVYALAGYLENAEGHARARVTEFTPGRGYAYLYCRGDMCAEAAYRMAAIGLLQIAEKYPRHLDVKFFDE